MKLDKFLESAKKYNPYMGDTTNCKACVLNKNMMCVIDKILDIFMDEYKKFVIENSTFEVVDGAVIVKVPEFMEVTVEYKDI